MRVEREVDGTMAQARDETEVEAPPEQEPVLVTTCLLREEGVSLVFEARRNSVILAFTLLQHRHFEIDGEA
jgi:hypothetical protein